MPRNSSHSNVFRDIPALRFAPLVVVAALGAAGLAGLIVETWTPGTTLDGELHARAFALHSQALAVGLFSLAPLLLTGILAPGKPTFGWVALAAWALALGAFALGAGVRPLAGVA
jgi:hypothetical protein